MSLDHFVLVGRYPYCRAGDSCFVVAVDSMLVIFVKLNLDVPSATIMIARDWATTACRKS